MSKSTDNVLASIIIIIVLIGIVAIVAVMASIDSASTGTSGQSTEQTSTSNGISIQSPANNSVVSSYPVTVQGVTASNSVVRFSNKGLERETNMYKNIWGDVNASENGQFTFVVDLAAGTNNILLSSSDSSIKNTWYSIVYKPPIEKAIRGHWRNRLEYPLNAWSIEWFFSEKKLIDYRNGISEFNYSVSNIDEQANTFTITVTNNDGKSVDIPCTFLADRTKIKCSDPLGSNEIEYLYRIDNKENGR